MEKAVILLSGGIDSTTCLALAKSQGFACHALSFNYQQRHSVELNAAKAIAAHFTIPHKIFNLDIGQFGGSALTDFSLDVPTYSDSSDIPITYVPARNTIFLSVALGFAEVLSAKHIFIGVSSVDFSHYPDCRPEYIQAFQQLANLATKVGVDGAEIKLHTPLLNLSKAETVELGTELGVDYAMTVSCYQANAEGHACGTCDSCALRKKGFQESRLADPTLYF